jgi:hypothetical protein
MNKNGLDIQIISTKWTDFQTDHVLLFGQVKEKREKAHPSFFKFLLTSRIPKAFGSTFSFDPSLKANPSAKPKEPIFSQGTENYNDIYRQ